MFRIIGAGLAGLLAGAMLRDECDEIMEAQAKLPNNHHALLRFRSPVVGDVLNIPFKKVSVIKAIISATGNPIGDAILYSRKTTGTASIRSIVNAKENAEDRYIAPPDFAQRLLNKLNWSRIYLDKVWDGSGPATISTIPMPALAKLLDYKFELSKFASVEGYVCTATIEDCEVYATLYFPGGDWLPYRASITGNKLIIEFAFPKQDGAEKMTPLLRYPMNLKNLVEQVLAEFGLDFSCLVAAVPEIKPQKFAKVLPVDENERRRFILWATEKHNIYSLGRFATWRPGLLLDDVVNDVRVIQRIANNTSYDQRRG